MDSKSKPGRVWASGLTFITSRRVSDISSISNPYMPFSSKLMRFLENQEKLRRLCSPPVDIYALTMAKTVNNALLLDPRQHAVWKACRMVSEHTRYFSAFNQFAGILGQSAFERQMEFAEKLQRLQPLLNPEHVRIASDLAESIEVTDEPADVIPLPRLDIESIHNDESRAAAVDNYVQAATDILEQDIPHHVTDWFERVYPIQRLRLWEKMPDKPETLIFLNEIIMSLLVQMVVASDVEKLKIFEAVCSKLLMAYCVFRCLFAAMDKACEEVNEKNHHL